jgi:hypothetical protein
LIGYVGDKKGENSPHGKLLSEVDRTSDTSERHWEERKKVWKGIVLVDRTSDTSSCFPPPFHFQWW